MNYSEALIFPQVLMLKLYSFELSISTNLKLLIMHDSIGFEGYPKDVCALLFGRKSSNFVSIIFEVVNTTTAFNSSERKYFFVKVLKKQHP